MVPFKFFKKNKTIVNPITYGWNVYEQKVMNIYKYCFDNNIEFIGFYQNFVENDQGKVLTIRNHLGGAMYSHIIYEIWDGELQAFQEYLAESENPK